MSHATLPTVQTASDTLPIELMELRDRVHAQAADVRSALEPLMEDVLEHARFRSRIMTVARDALERFRLDLEMARFDLDATRREREKLQQMLDEQA